TLSHPAHHGCERLVRAESFAALRIGLTTAGYSINGGNETCPKPKALGLEDGGKDFERVLDKLVPRKRKQ
ncbi:MAG TPA: hypothetical protein VGQ19_16100, partial [Burkholderiales bacterium]|nr:hypothetical protein [Burkholderiales bacterium]